MSPELKEAINGAVDCMILFGHNAVADRLSKAAKLESDEDQAYLDKCSFVALQGMLSNPNCNGKGLAQASHDLATGMLAERKKRMNLNEK